MIFENPVRVNWGMPDFSGLPDLVAGRSAALVTTSGADQRGFVQVIRSAGFGADLRVCTAVQPNPTVASIQAAAAHLLESGNRPQVIIALGGGSTLDTAKGIAAIASPGCSPQWFPDHLRSGVPFPDSFAPPAIIAIPTTAGTGSEVTMWGTVWDEISGAKYSISHKRLYPEHALLIPELTLSAPANLTLFTALDALSHCMESIWNKRASAVSDAFASAGISRIIPSLSRALGHPDDLAARRRLQEGALLGGLAISCTATALAHSISYPLTSQLRMPHGLACSFTLPAMIRFNGAVAPERIGVIAQAMETKGAGETALRLSRIYSEWKVSEHVASYIDREKAGTMKDRLLTPGRADNNVRLATHEDALKIVLDSF